jgi:LuxR family maltose regulon positive regulatory protein
MQMFLLQTSILDRLCGPLCDAVLGLSAELLPTSGGGSERPRRAAEGSYSHLILNELDRENLFLVPLDTERNWYRYHHLFGEVLRERLTEGTSVEQVALLNRRASAWYAAHGLIPSAVDHALRAGAVDDVVSILEPIGLAMATRVGEATLRSWLPAIPDAIIRARPRLALLRAWLSLADYEGDTARVWLAVAEDALARVAAGESEGIGNVANLRGEICAVRARLATIRGDAAEVVANASQALELLQYENLALRTRVAKDLGYAYMVQGDFDRAIQAFAEAMTNGFSAGVCAVRPRQRPRRYPGVPPDDRSLGRPRRSGCPRLGAALLSPGGHQPRAPRVCQRIAGPR